MIEFRVGLTIRDITTSRNVEIVDIDPAFEGDSLMPAILPPNPVEVTVIMQRLAGNDGNAVIALFTPDRLMRIASLTDGFTRKGIIRAFGFLQAQHVRRLLFKQAKHQRQPEPDRIDIPGDDFHAMCFIQFLPPYAYQISMISGNIHHEYEFQNQPYSHEFHGHLHFQNYSSM